MAFLLVTYELNLKNEHPRYNDIRRYLNTLAPMTQLTDSSVGITTSKNITQVYLDLKNFLTDQDTLLVLALGDSWSGQVSTRQENNTLQALTTAMGEKLNHVMQTVAVRPIGDVLKELAEAKAQKKS